MTTLQQTRTENISLVITKVLSAEEQVTEVIQFDKAELSPRLGNGNLLHISFYKGNKVRAQHERVSPDMLDSSVVVKNLSSVSQGVILPLPVPEYMTYHLNQSPENARKAHAEALKDM